MMLEEKVLETISRHRMIRRGDHVIVAVSGGADSVALFHLLVSLRERLGMRLSVAHFEHGLRGEESLAEAAFVGRLSEKVGVPFFVRSGGMCGDEKPPGESVEAWARRLRYEFFGRLVDQQGALLATAHTLSDNAETVLFNAIRGAGPRGLSGIPPVRGPYIRPLIDISRTDVEAYCELLDLAFVTDSTNDDLSFTRNRIRHDVLPRLEVAHNGAAKSLSRLAEDMRQLDSWLEEMAVQLLEKATGPGGARKKFRPADVNRPGGLALDGEVLLAAPDPVLRKAIALLLEGRTSRDALARFEAVLLGRAAGAQMPGGLVVQWKGEKLVVSPGTKAPEEALGYEVALAAGPAALPGGFSLAVAICGEEQKSIFTEKNTEKPLTFWADYDKIYHCGVFRTRRTGDRFTFPARGVSKTLKKWMNEVKMDPALRQSLPVLAEEGTSDLLWIWDEGFSARVQPDGRTSRYLRITQKAR